MARQVLENGVILPAEYSDDWYDDMTSNLTKLDDVIGSDSEKLSSADVGAAALSNNYNDLDNLPTIPTVNDATLTIQKNGVDVQTFTANASSNVTANITVPTKTSDLTNDSNFVDTSNSAVSSGITSAKVTSYDSHIADTDIHVTNADKTKWNNGISQSYVLRYSSASVTDNSTIAYSTLDNTDNIKASDKVIDVDGKIFSVVSVDTTNETVTVGSALIDLAIDSNVMHLSGDESASGIKAFIGTRTEFKRSNGDGVILFSNGSFSKGSTPNDTINICRKYYGDATSIGSVLGYNSVSVGNNGNKTTYQFYCIDNTAGSTSRTTIQMNYDKSLSGTDAQYVNISGSLLPSIDNSYSLGNSTTKWATINGLNPGSLSMPDLSNGIDISSYFDLSLYTGQTYTPTVNGWISISITSPNRGSILCESTGLSQTAYGVTDPDDNTKYRVSILIPCQKNQTLTTYIRASGGTINNAKFYPCQGNV